MELQPVDSARPMEIGAIAVFIFLICLGLARIFRVTQRFFRRPLRRYIPERISLIASITIALIIFWSIANGLIFRLALRIADSAYKTLDEIVQTDIPKLDQERLTGSAESLIEWDDLGRAGQTFLSNITSSSELSAQTNLPALKPVRVYVGLRSSETVKERAELALNELIRAGGFNRSVLVVATPTGTGLMDPAAFVTLEFLHRGDVATVALQYSYLGSWISMLVEPEYGSDSAVALFQAIYRHWSSLPKDARPRLYLFGLSLGALNSERSWNFIEQMADPIDGALWSGPPFLSSIWSFITLNRNPDSPYWLPMYGNGSIIRFTAQANAINDVKSDWGPIRIVYLQYASDPIVFFEPSAFYREPEWMKAPRGPDVSKDFYWFPIVTGLQLLIDMSIATTTPFGYCIFS